MFNLVYQAEQTIKEEIDAFGGAFGNQRRVTRNQNGRIFVIFEKYIAPYFIYDPILWCAYSDNGISWTQVQIGTTFPSIIQTEMVNASIAIGSDNTVHFAWARTDFATGDSKVFYRKMNANGTLNSIETVETSSAANRYFYGVDIALDSSNNPYILEAHAFSDAGGGATFYDKLSMSWASSPIIEDPDFIACFPTLILIEDSPYGLFTIESTVTEEAFLFDTFFQSVCSLDSYDSPYSATVDSQNNINVAFEERVDSSIKKIRYMKGVPFDWGDPEDVYVSSFTQENPSITITGGDGSVYVFWNEEGFGIHKLTKQLVYSRKREGVWSTPIALTDSYRQSFGSVLRMSSQLPSFILDDISYEIVVLREATTYYQRGFHLTDTSGKKTYLYRVYDDSTSVTTWSKEVLSIPTFRTVINGGASDLTIKLAREFDSFGEGVDVKLGNRVNVHCYDRDNPNGILIYSGFISGYKPVINGSSEYVEITVLPYVSEFSNYILEGSARTTNYPQNSLDPGTMFRNVLSSYRAQGGTINYDNNTVQLTSTIASYTFDLVTIKEALDKIIELTPDDWFWRADPNGYIYLEESNLEENDHSFFIKKHISKMETWRRSEDILNRVYFVGGDPGSGVLYRVYENSGSIGTYGLHAEKLVDQRVTVTATADLIARRAINRRKDPEIRTSITILDNNGDNPNIGYDIESIKPGQTMNIRNLQQGTKTLSLWDVFRWEEDVWDQTLSYASVSTIQIQAVQYHPNYVVIEASSRSPIIAKRIEDLKRNIEDVQTTDVPTTPTVIT